MVQAHSLVSQILLLLFYYRWFNQMMEVRGSYHYGGQRVISLYCIMVIVVQSMSRVCGILKPMQCVFTIF